MAPSPSARRTLSALAGIAALCAIVAVAVWLVWGSGVIPGSAAISRGMQAVAARVSPASAGPPKMPDVVGKDVQSVATSLSAMGYSVEVVLPERRTGLDTNPGSPNEGDEYVLPRITVTFAKGKAEGAPANWLHTVTRQQPPAGSALASETQVVLTAGRHAGQGLEDPWYSTHKLEEASKSPEFCLQCHTYEECTTCHATYRDKTPTDGSEASGTDSLDQ